MRITLTDTEHSTLVNALHTARTKYLDCAYELAQDVPEAQAAGFARLVAQFNAQAADVAKILDRLE